MKVIKNTIMAGLALLTGFAFAENTSAYTESLMIFADSTDSQENTLQSKTESESTSQANASQENTLQNELAPEQKPSPEQQTLAEATQKENPFFLPSLASAYRPPATPFSFGIFCSLEYEVDGLQASSLFNYAAVSKGFQLAGLANVSSKSSYGIQCAGIFNAAVTFQGLQFSGLLNMAGKQSSGIQAAGLANVVAGDFYGVQGSGLLNITGGNLRGVQIGLVNICSGDASFQLGLLNFSQNGIFEIETSYTSFSRVRLTFNSGSKFLYTVLGVSARDSMFQKDEPWGLNLVPAVSAGLGTRLYLGNVSLDFAILMNTLIQTLSERDFYDYSFISTRYTIGFQVSKHFNIFVGDTVMLENAKTEHIFKSYITHPENEIERSWLFIFRNEFDIGFRLALN